MDMCLDHRSKLNELADLLSRHPGFCVLTGAGVSTKSGLPAYRDVQGAWKHSKPMQHHDFISSEAKRKFYWARSMLGWSNFKNAKPSDAHISIAALENMGFVGPIITQNVDRLHQRAGSEKTVDLHGRLDQLICLDCKKLSSRQEFQLTLELNNPDFTAAKRSLRPDGDVDIDSHSLQSFVVPVCEHCNGILKPNVVFFGDVLNPEIVNKASRAVDASPGLIVVGSSLMVYSGYRYVKQAAQLHKPVIIVNQGLTRADDLYDLKIDSEAGESLSCLCKILLNSESH